MTIIEIEEWFDERFTNNNKSMHPNETMLFEPTTSSIKIFYRKAFKEALEQMSGSDEEFTDENIQKFIKEL